jgi:TonB family protein
MTHAVFIQDQRESNGLLIAAFLLSIGVHILFAVTTAAFHNNRAIETQWVEMVMEVVIPKELPPPPPMPEVAPPEPAPKAEPVQEKIKEAPLPDIPEPAAPPPQMIQGLTNQSFLLGAGTGITVRAGTTTSVRATNELMDLKDANGFQLVPYARITSPPKMKNKRALSTPKEITALGIQGSVATRITVSATGAVDDVEIVESFHPIADQHCIQYLKQSKWKPGMREDRAVTTHSVPFTCTFKQRVP